MANVGTGVSTSYRNGTVITLDPVNAHNLLLNLAINTISLCKGMYTVEEYQVLKCKSNVLVYDELINNNLDGVASANLFNLLKQNVEVLYEFVADCVSNDTCAGLYMWSESELKLITLALEEYDKFISDTYNEKSSYSDSNEDFLRIVQS